MWKKTFSPWNTSRFGFGLNTIATYKSSATPAPVLSTGNGETLAKKEGTRIEDRGSRKEKMGMAAGF
jgi:hypothetical protein